MLLLWTVVIPGTGSGRRSGRYWTMTTWVLRAKKAKDVISMVRALKGALNSLCMAPLEEVDESTTGNSSRLMLVRGLIDFMEFRTPSKEPTEAKNRGDSGTIAQIRMVMTSGIAPPT